jgi:hypothetical protein
MHTFYLENSADEDAGVTLALEELMETSMRGSMNETAVQRAESGEVTSTVFVSIALRVGFWGDRPRPCQ